MSIAVPYCAGVCAARPPLGPDAGPLGARWAATEDGPQQYPNVHVDWDVPIRMSDGVALKANVYRPADAGGAPAAARTPVVLNLTPYTKLVSALLDGAQSVPGLSGRLLTALRDTDFPAPFDGVSDLTRAFGNGLLRDFSVDRQLVRGGYTQVVVDVRGTGFSQGDWDVFGPREQRDTLETIDWAAHQPWSDGDIGMNGVSYSGINQLQAAEHHPPALKALFPIVPGSDLTQDVLAPGGAVGVAFIPMWLELIDFSKLIPDLSAALRGQFDTKWLADRAADPLTFLSAVQNILSATQISEFTPQVRAVLDAHSTLRRAWLGDPGQIRVPTFVTGGWHDLFTNSESTIFTRIPLPTTRKKLLMGNTYHANPGSESGRPGWPPRLDVLQRAWFDKWLKGIDNGIDRYGPVILRQQGGGWITSPTFVQPGIAYRRVYLSALSSGTAPISAHDGSLFRFPGRGTAELTVAPGLSALCSNDSAQGTAGQLSIVDACGKDARLQETNGLTFTSAPVTAPTTVSGALDVHLNTVLDAPDGYWDVTVNDVAPDGQSSVLGSGQLVASLRAIDNAHSTRLPDGDYTDAQPYVSLDRRSPVPPGRSTQLDISVPGTDAILLPGHRLRVDVYAGNFPKSLPPMPLLLASGLRPQHLLLSPDAPSYLVVGLDRDLG